MSGRAAETPGTDTGAVPGALTLEGIAGLMRDFPRPKLHQLRCHPSVITLLRVTTAGAVPQPGVIPGLTGIPVIEKPDMEPWSWELYEDGEMIESGRLRLRAPEFPPPPFKPDWGPPFRMDRGTP